MKYKIKNDSDFEKTLEIQIDGALEVRDASGERGFVPIDQVAGYNAVKAAPDRNTFIANFPSLQATNPGLANLDAGTFYDRMINLSGIN